MVTEGGGSVGCIRDGLWLSEGAVISVWMCIEVTQVLGVGEEAPADCRLRFFTLSKPNMR